MFAAGEYIFDDDDDDSQWLRDMPSVDEIIEEAIKELGFTDESMRKQNLYNVLVALEKKCHEIYLRYEDRIRENFRRGKYGSVDSRTFETSLRNARMARAGQTLEKLLARLLNVYGLRFSRDVHYFNGEVEFDYVFPDENTPFTDPEHSVLVSLKRQVRERWKLTVGDAYILRHKYGYPTYDNIWFVALYEMPYEAVTAMTPLCIRVYVPDDLFDDVLANVAGRLTAAERSRVKRFSDIINDLIRIVVKKEERAQPCRIELRQPEGVGRTLLSYTRR